MSRIRYLKPDFFKDEDLKELSFEVRLVFAGLWCHADRSGRLEDRPEKLKVEIMPYDSIDMHRALCQLAGTKRGRHKPFIIRYTINDNRYIQIVEWDKHQKPHHTEHKSVIPAPSKDNPMPLVPKDKEKENGDGECDKRSTELRHGAIPVKEPLIDKDRYMGITDVNKLPDNIKIICYYKKTKGVDVWDVKWDDRHFDKALDISNRLLEMFSGNTRMCMDCIKQRGGSFTRDGYTWHLGTILKHAPDWIIDKKAKDRVK